MLKGGRRAGKRKPIKEKKQKKIKKKKSSPVHAIQLRVDRTGQDKILKLWKI